MSTLIERLRRAKFANTEFPSGIAHEAANRIEHLEAERDVLKEIVKAVAAECPDWLHDSDEVQCLVPVGILRRARTALAEPMHKTDHRG